MKNKSLLIIIAVFAVVLIGAGILYSSLSEGMAPTTQLQTQAPVTEAPVESSPAPDSTAPDSSEATESTEESEPETIPAPDFTVYDKDGNQVKLSDYFGKPIILNFWASWCGPCQMEMPEFEEKYQEYGEDIQFLMVNMTDGSRETVETATEAVEAGGYTFPVLFDSDIDAATVYGVMSLPTTYGIDAEGNAVVRAIGAIDGSAVDQIVEMIS